jgi:hypothetical protein
MDKRISFDELRNKLALTDTSLTGVEEKLKLYDDCHCPEKNKQIADLEESIRTKDLDIEMLYGALVVIKELVDKYQWKSPHLKTWQKEEKSLET